MYSSTHIRHVSTPVDKYKINVLSRLVRPKSRSHVSVSRFNVSVHFCFEHLYDTLTCVDVAARVFKVIIGQRVVVQ